MSSNCNGSGGTDEKLKIRSHHLLEVVDRVREMNVQKSTESDSSVNGNEYNKRRREDVVADDEDAEMTTQSSSSDDDQPLDFSSKKIKSEIKDNSSTSEPIPGPSRIHDNITENIGPSTSSTQQSTRSITPPQPQSTFRQQLHFGEGFIGNLLSQNENNRQLCSDGNSDRSSNASDSSPRRNSPLPIASTSAAAAALLSAVTSQSPNSPFANIAAAANALTPALNTASSSTNSSPEIDLPSNGLLTTVPHDYRAIGFLRAAALLSGQKDPNCPIPIKPEIPASLRDFINGKSEQGDDSDYSDPTPGPSSSFRTPNNLMAAPSVPTPNELLELQRVKEESDSNFLQYRSNMMSQMETTRPKGRRPINKPVNRIVNPIEKFNDPGYYERRKKNNEAAKRSRDARRSKENEIALRAQFLETENGELKIQLATLRSEIAALRIQVYGSPNPPHHNGPVV